MADPEEENLKTVYFALLDFFEANNPEKMSDEDALAVLLDFWIDYGLDALNRILRRKYSKGIDNVMDPYVGGILARKNRTKNGWPYPSNHALYKDPLAPLLEVDDSIVLPPPNREPPKDRSSSAKPRKTQKSTRVTTNNTNNTNNSSRRENRNNTNNKQGQRERERERERKPKPKVKQRDDKAESAKRRKREDRGPSQRGGQPSGRMGPRREGAGKRVGGGAREQGTRRGKKGGEGGESAEGFRRSLHYKDRSRQRQNRQAQGSRQRQQPKFGQFRGLEEFDNPSDVKLGTQHFLEAFYGKYNKEILGSATGVSALVKWVDSHSMEEFNKNLRKKYGATTEDPAVKRDAVRRKNIETVLTGLYDFYDKTKLRKTDLSQMVTKVMFAGVDVLNKEIKHYNKSPQRA